MVVIKVPVICVTYMRDFPSLTRTGTATFRGDEDETTEGTEDEAKDPLEGRWWWWWWWWWLLLAAGPPLAGPLLLLLLVWLTFDEESEGPWCVCGPEELEDDVLLLSLMAFSFAWRLHLYRWFWNQIFTCTQTRGALFLLAVYRINLIAQTKVNIPSLRGRVMTRTAGQITTVSSIQGTLFVQAYKE